MKMTIFKEKTAFYGEMINAHLETILKEKEIPRGLSEAMLYSVESGGKRLRPAMLLATTDMFHGELKRALPLAAALEMIHTYSLIHDDLPSMDNDDIRRGKPSSHKQFGEATAILAGDALLTYAFQEILDGCPEIGNKEYLEAGAMIARAAGPAKMVAGQFIDVNNDSLGDETTLVSLHRLKTGALFEAAMYAGTILTGGRDYIKNILDFADVFGILFQITDDILDASGNSLQLGKAVHKDAKMNKLTYVTLFGLEGAKKHAIEISTLAKAHLSSIDKCFDTQYFLELIDFCVERNN
ncbi:MAG: polyprenyl synthetase family protein [Clostridia bacterium]